MIPRLSWTRHLKRSYGPYQMTGIDPSRSLTLDDANVRFRIAERTLLVRRSLCAAAFSAIVGFLIHKRTWDQVLQLVSL
jgi:hypothetical protein